MDIYMVRAPGPGARHVLNRFWWTSGTPFPDDVVNAYPPGCTIEPDDGTPIWVPPPDSVSPLQFRKAIKAWGLREVFDQFVQMQGQDAVDEIEYAVSIVRTHHLVEQARLLLGMSEDQRDDLFRLAASFT